MTTTCQHLDRFMDEIQALDAVMPGLEEIGREAYTRRPDVEIQRYGLTIPDEPTAMPNGGVVVLWVGRWPRVIATLVRDVSNFTIVSVVEYPECEVPHDHVE